MKTEKFAVDHGIAKSSLKDTKKVIKSRQKRQHPSNIVQIESGQRQKRPRESYSSCLLASRKTGSFVRFLWFSFFRGAGCETFSPLLPPSTIDIIMHEEASDRWQNLSLSALRPIIFSIKSVLDGGGGHECENLLGLVLGDEEFSCKLSR